MLGLALAMVILLPEAANSCGYDTCHPIKQDMINVHILPHTHDDVGWLKTVDQYYYGSRKDITPVGVQYILDSVVQALADDPSKRFIYVETAFFWRWWKEQNEKTQNLVKQLVQAGQLEFIGGGWCMNDEAATHYNAIVDQMTWGFRRLNDTFGECARPKIAWQIDPFGHSKEQANLFAQMGFEGLFFGRLDWQDKSERVKKKTMEMVWKASQSLGDSGSIFTGALYNGYGPPAGFCWDAFCSDEPIMDDPNMHDYNLHNVLKKFEAAAYDWAGAYATDHILMTMGSDFHYTNANSWYRNLDKLIKYVNSKNQFSETGKKGRKQLHLIYSTPSCYLKALHDSGKKWSSKTDDFFPYSSDPHAYWTGYFTSRPSLKGMVREGNNLLQVCKQQAALTKHQRSGGDSEKVEAQVTKMREVMGVLQHHDAVSGTAKQAVTFDYAQRLSAGFKACENVLNETMAHLTVKANSHARLPEQRYCRYLNVSSCGISENYTTFVVHLYNPLTRPVEKFVRLPIRDPGFEVFAPNGESILTQVVPVPNQVKLIPGRKSLAKYELVFMANLPGLGFKSYYVTRNPSMAKKQISKMTKIKKKTVMANKGVSVGVDAKGKLNKIQTGKKAVKLSQNFAFYESHSGNNEGSDHRASGAYIFRPLKQTPTDIPSKSSSTLFQGPLVQEIHQDFSPYGSQIVRIYGNDSNVEFNYVIGPIPIKDNKGREIVSRFTTDLHSNSRFTTDSNGRQLLERQRNFRPTWKLKSSEPVSQNYYPVNSRIGIRDVKNNVQVTVLTDRSQGGTSMHDGQIELMVHRRMLYDDAFGVGEALNEMAYGKGLVIRGRHWLQVTENEQEGAREHRFLGQQIFMDSRISFNPTKLSFKSWQQIYQMERSMVNANVMPENVHLLTLEEWTDDKFLLRLEHIFDVNEHTSLSRPVTFSIRNLFQDFYITSATELTLGANMEQSKLNRFKWNVVRDNTLGVTADDDDAPTTQTDNDDDALTIKLKPMQIRSFAISMMPK